MPAVLTLRFDDGTLLLEGAEPHLGLVGDLVTWDPRVKAHRARAGDYQRLVRAVHGKADYADEAKAYAELQLRESEPMPMRPYQRAALEAWEGNKRRGVVVLPTGAGKTYVALKAMLSAQRSTLVLCPTIDLVQQWASDLERRLGIEVGRYGGGERELRDVTVSTYDSGILIMPSKGNRFGLLVCDECHHLPAPVTAQAAQACLAPFRLGLTATPERSDGSHSALAELLGPQVHRVDITELEGGYLASYQAEVRS